MTGDIFDAEFDSYNDENVWNLISSDKTTCLFQIGTDTYKKRMPRLAPKTIQELAACLALVRGPCISAGSDETYMKIKEGTAEIELIHPAYDDATKNTNGILIYQEDLMQLCNNMGLDLEDSFRMMKAAAKKKRDVLNSYKTQMWNNIKNNMTIETFERIFKIIEDASRYLFNQAHKHTCGTI